MNNDLYMMLHTQVVDETTKNKLFLTTLLDTIPNPIYYKDQRGYYLGCNSAFRQFFGIDDITGKTAFDVFPESFANDYDKKDQELLQNNEKQIYEVKGVFPDGQERTAIVHKDLFIDSARDQKVIVGVLMDITDRKKTIEARSVAAAAEMAIQAMESMADPVLLTDAAGYIKQVNKSFIDMIGFSEATIGSHIQSVISNLSKEELANYFKTCAQKRHLRNIDTLIQTENKQNLAVLINLTVIFDTHDCIDGFLVSFRDISKIISTNRKLKEKEDTLHAIMNAAEDAVFLLNIDGTIRQCNTAFAKRFNTEPDALIEKKVFELPESDFKSIRLRFLEQIVEKKVPEHVQYENANKAFYNSGYPIFNQDNELDGIAVFSYDVSERIQSEHLQRAIYAISEAAYYAQDMQNLYRLVHRILSKLILTTNFYIALHDKAKEQVCFSYYVDEKDKTHTNGVEWYRIGENSITEYLIHQGRALRYKKKDLVNLIDSGTASIHGTIPEDWMGVPLRTADGEVIGAMVSQTYTEGSSFQDSDIRIFTFVSSQIAMVIERKRQEENLIKSNSRLKKIMDGTLLALSKTVEMRDPYTAGHQLRVASLAEAIALKMALPESRISALRTAALLHDIGKIYVPSELLSKPGHLSEVEFNLIKTHSSVSYDILKPIEFEEPISLFVRHHHEKMNGTGYPDGIKGSAIELESRIICVADVLDAMISHRPYRPSLGMQYTMTELLSQSGILYDSEVVDICLEMYKNKEFNFDTFVLNKNQYFLSERHD